MFAIGDSVNVENHTSEGVAIVKNITHVQGLGPVYQVQFANGEVWSGVVHDALSEVIEV